MKDGLNFTGQIEGGNMSGSGSNRQKKKMADGCFRLGLLKNREWKFEGGSYLGETLKARIMSLSWILCAAR